MFSFLNISHRQIMFIIITPLLKNLNNKILTIDILSAQNSNDVVIYINKQFLILFKDFFFLNRVCSEIVLTEFVLKLYLTALQWKILAIWVHKFQILQHFLRVFLQSIYFCILLFSFSFIFFQYTFFKLMIFHKLDFFTTNLN